MAALPGSGTVPNPAAADEPRAPWHVARGGTMRDTFLGPETSSQPCSSGVILADGTRYFLAGQPPVAQTNGWGNLSFLVYKNRIGGDY